MRARFVSDSRLARCRGSPGSVSPAPTRGRWPIADFNIRPTRRFPARRLDHLHRPEPRCEQNQSPPRLRSSEMPAVHETIVHVVASLPEPCFPSAETLGRNERRHVLHRHDVRSHFVDECRESVHQLPPLRATNDRRTPRVGRVRLARSTPDENPDVRALPRSVKLRGAILIDVTADKTGGGIRFVRIPAAFVYVDALGHVRPADSSPQVSHPPRRTGQQPWRFPSPGL